MNVKHIVLTIFIAFAPIVNAADATDNTMAIHQPHDILVTPAHKITPHMATTTAPAPTKTPGILDMRLLDIYHQLMAFIFQEERMLSGDIEQLKSDLLRDTTELEQLVKDAGFKISEIKIGVGLIPKIDLSFDVERVLTSEEKAAVRTNLASRKDSALVRWIIRTLLDARDFPLQGYGLSAVDMSINIIPDVTLKLNPSKQ